jgi:3-oxoadipate enol-lactonase
VPYLTTRDDCKIFYRFYQVDTLDSVVIFLNGITQTTMYWGGLVPSFAKRCSVLCYDARCQGKSDAGAAPLSLQLHVSDLHHLMAHLAVDKVRLVGISHGARVALEFALKFPQLVDRLVLCSLAAGDCDRSEAFVRSWLEILNLAGLRAMAWAAVPAVFGGRFLKQHEKILDKIVNAVVLRNSKEALAAQLAALLKYPKRDGISAQLKVPTLLVSGTEDPLIDSDGLRHLADLCGARHTVLPGIGHSVPVEAPKLFEQTLLDFLGSGDRRPDRTAAGEGRTSTIAPQLR